MSYDKARQQIERLAKACRVAARQWEGGHPIGHDAICELHRALKAAVPGLKRPAVTEMCSELAHEIAEDDSKSVLDSMLGSRDDSQGVTWRDLNSQAAGCGFYIERAVRYLEVEGILKRSPEDPQLIGWDEMEEEDA